MEGKRNVQVGTPSRVVWKVWKHSSCRGVDQHAVTWCVTFSMHLLALRVGQNVGSPTTQDTSDTEPGVSSSAGTDTINVFLTVYAGKDRFVFRTNILH